MTWSVAPWQTSSKSKLRGTCSNGGKFTASSFCLAGTWRLSPATGEGARGELQKPFLCCILTVRRCSSCNLSPLPFSVSRGRSGRF